MNTAIRFFVMLALFALLVPAASAQVTLPHYDGFNYTAGTMLRDQGGWLAVNSGDTVWVSAGSLSYSGFPASVGNKIAFNGSGQEQTKLFTTISTGTFYFSYLLRVTSLAGIKGEAYISGLYQSATSTTTGTLVWVKQDGTGFVVGVSARTVPNAPVNYYPTTQSLNSTILVVGAYQFVDGTSNDSAKVWINPSASTFGKTAPAPSAVSVNTATDLTALARFMIRQDADTTTPYCEIDELRLGTSWAEVTQAISATKVEEADGLAPRGFTLKQNYPNPFNPTTTIRFSVASAGHVSLNVTDVLGRQVAALVNESLTPGTYSVRWNASAAPSGIYIYALRAGNYVETRRMVLVK